MLTEGHDNDTTTRRRDFTVSIPSVKTTRYGQKSFSFEAAWVWNSLLNELRKCEYFPEFRRLVHIFDFVRKKDAETFGRTKNNKMKKFINCITEMWHKWRKKNRKEKGQTVEMLAVQENHEHSIGCTNSLQSEKVQSLHKSLSTTSLLSMAPSLSLTSLNEDDFEPPTSVVPYECQMSSSVRSLPCLDDNSFVQNLEYKQTLGHPTSLELISRNRCLSSSCISIYCSTVGHSIYNSSFSCQLDTFDLFQLKPTSSIEALNLAQLSRNSHQHNRLWINAVDGSLGLNPTGDERFISDRDSENLIETAVTETVEESPACGKSHFGSCKRVLNLENDDSERQNQIDIILKSTEVRTYMGQHHKKQKLQANKLTTAKKHVDSHQVNQYRQNDKEPVVIRRKDLYEKHHCKRKAHLFQQKELREQKLLRKKAIVFKQRGRDGKKSLKSIVGAFRTKGLDGLKEKRRKKAHVFHLKGRNRKGIPKKKVHDFQQKDRDRKGSLRRRAQLFHQKGRDRKERGRRRAHVHVFHQKGWYRKGNMRRKVLLEHKGWVDRRESLRRRAHVFHQKGWGGKEIPRKRTIVFHYQGCDRRKSLGGKAHVFHQKSLDRKERSLDRKERIMHVFNWKILGGKNCVGRNVQVFQLKAFDGKDGVKVWANKQLFCNTTVSDNKCPRTNSENKKRKKQLPVNTPKKPLDWQTIEAYNMFGSKKTVQEQAMNLSQQNLRKFPGKLSTEQRYKVEEYVYYLGDIAGQIIWQPRPVHERRPGGKPLPNSSHVLQPRSEQTKQDAEKSEQDSESKDKHTTPLGAVYHDMSQTEHAAAEREAYNADFQKKLPSAKGCLEFERRNLLLIYTCQMDCILFTIFLLVYFHPQMEQKLREADDGFQWLHTIWIKCNAGKFDDAKFAFWLKHRNFLPVEDYVDFKVNLEADWILESLDIKIFQQMSKCKTCEEPCVFAEEDKYFQNSIKAFTKRCLRLGKQFTSFQDCIEAWSSEKTPCSKCENGYCSVTRKLDCDRGPPPLLPIPTFFEESESSGHLVEFPLPVPLDDHHPTLEQPQEFSTGSCRYQLHTLSYAINKQIKTGESYLHERCKVWDNRLGLWQYYDGEGWNEDFSNYKLKTEADNTPGKSYRVAYFRLLDDKQ